MNSQLSCPITCDYPIFPIICLTDGKIYDTIPLLMWISKHYTSPYNRNPTQLTDLVDLQTIVSTLSDLSKLREISRTPDEPATPLQCIFSQHIKSLNHILNIINVCISDGLYPNQDIGGDVNTIEKLKTTIEAMLHSVYRKQQRMRFLDSF